MKILYTTFLLTISLYTTVLQAQPYELSVSSAAFVPLTNATPAVNGTWDDPGFTAPIGFDFEYFGETTTNLYVLEEFIGGFAATNVDVQSLNLILAFAADLVDRGREAGTP